MWDGVTNVSPERAWAAIINAHDTQNDALRVNLIAGDTVTLSGTVTVTDGTTAISDGRKTVASAGTAEALAASTSCKWVILTAETDNTGLVVIGGSTVVASLSTRRGTPLYAGDSVVVITDNLADIFLDVTVSGDGVTYQYGA